MTPANRSSRVLWWWTLAAFSLAALAGCAAEIERAPGRGCSAANCVAITAQSPISVQGDADGPGAAVQGGADGVQGAGSAGAPGTPSDMSDADSLGEAAGLEEADQGAQAGDSSSEDAGSVPAVELPPVGLCEPSDIIAEGCVAEVEEGLEGLCDGLDNDCDGVVDERCGCVGGEVQRCFAGPPGRRNVGACTDGTQTCQGVEFGTWGPCQGGIVPGEEVCDTLDNDCNGCRDEIPDCQPERSCPGPGDPRTPDGVPFSSYPLNGADFFDGEVSAWQWEVQGTPCDKLFQGLPGSAATSDNGQLSYRLRGGDQQQAGVDFTLSGDYAVTLRATRPDGSEEECSWVVHVRAPGVRVELCWDTTGPTSAGNSVDVDLHLGKHGATGAWFGDMDCYYTNCTLEPVVLFGLSVGGPPDWGYGASGISACSGPGSNGNFINSCPNPRLDVDNVSEINAYVPENANVDNPDDGDQFRVMVHHFSSSKSFDTHPLVNVYCGGELRGTYGANPRLTGFRDGGSDGGGDMWRVVDITARASGGVTTGCDLAPLSSNGDYDVTTDETRY